MIRKMGVVEVEAAEEEEAAEEVTTKMEIMIMMIALRQLL
jgi:hypothetical protein